MHRFGVEVLVRDLTLIIWRPMVCSYRSSCVDFIVFGLCMSLSQVVELGGSRDGSYRVMGSTCSCCGEKYNVVLIG